MESKIYFIGNRKVTEEEFLSRESDQAAKITADEVKMNIKKEIHRKLKEIEYLLKQIK